LARRVVAFIVDLIIIVPPLAAIFIFLLASPLSAWTGDWL